MSQNRKRNLLSTVGTSFCLWLALTLFTPGQAVPWSNQFVEFDLAPNWSCSLEGAEWVCQSADKEKKRDAIIILAAKLKGDQDSLDQYEAYLKQPKKYTSIQGKPVQSEVKSTKQSVIANHPWIDALHLESEIPGFYTRYLATVVQDIAVLVTYSINKDKYSEYQSDFDSLVKTLRVFRRAGLGLNAASKDQKLFDSITPPSNISATSIFETAKKEDGSNDKQNVNPTSGDDSSTLIIILAIAVVGFIIWKRRRG